MSAALLALMLTACARNMPSATSELGRIARMANYEERSAALRRFAQARLRDRPGLRRELLAGGFIADRSTPGCEYFHWHGLDWGDVFEEVMIVGLCGDTVTTNSGAIAL